MFSLMPDDIILKLHIAKICLLAVRMLCSSASPAGLAATKMLLFLQVCMYFVHRFFMRS